MTPVRVVDLVARAAVAYAGPAMSGDRDAARWMHEATVVASLVRLLSRIPVVHAGDLQILHMRAAPLAASLGLTIREAGRLREEVSARKAGAPAAP